MPFFLRPLPFMLRTRSVSSACVVRHPHTFLPALVTHPCLGHLAWSFCLAVGSAPAAVVAWLFLRHSKRAPGPRAFALAVRCCALPGSFPHLLRVSAVRPLVTAFKIPAPCAPSFISPFPAEFSSEHLVMGGPKSSFGFGRRLWPSPCLVCLWRSIPASASALEGGCLPAFVSRSTPRASSGAWRLAGARCVLC